MLSSSRLELSSNAWEANRKFLVLIRAICKFHYFPLQNLLDFVGRSGEDIEEITDGVNAFLCNPPYNTRRIAEFASSEHKQLGLTDMRLLHDVFSVVMDLRGMENCCVLRFSSRPGTIC